MELCAARPGTRFTLSELSRALDMSKATAYALLSTLCGHGWLARDADTKTYAIGPGLAVLADAIAVPHRALVDAARHGLAALVASTGLRATAATTMGDEVLILDVAGVARPFGTALLPGHRMRMVPPIGVVYVAWSPEEHVERWLRRGAAAPSEEDAVRLRAAVDAVRRHGYAVSLRTFEVRRLAQALRSGEVACWSLDEVGAADYLAAELDPDQASTARPR